MAFPAYVLVAGCLALGMSVYPILVFVEWIKEVIHESKES